MAWLIALSGLMTACSNDNFNYAPRYTISGTVSGLDSTGLVLANGGKTIAVSEGALTFSAVPAAEAATVATVAAAAPVLPDRFFSVGANGGVDFANGGAGSIAITLNPP